MTQSTASSAGLGVLDKAMALLNIVSSARAPMTFTDLQRASSFPKATLHRILNTLVREGLLRHDAYNKTFQLGFRLLELAHEVWSDFDLRVAAQDELVRLRDAVGESVQLAVLNAQQVIVAASEEAHRESPTASKLGLRLPLRTSAAAQAIAACLDMAQQNALLEAHGLSNDAALRGMLDLARARGYALASEGTGARTVVSVAAPIFDVEGRPVGALAIVGAGARLDAPRAHGLSAMLIGAARAVTHGAGGQPMSITPGTAPATAEPVQVACVGTARALLGEGPMWSPRDHALYWVDILTPAVHRLDGSSGRTQESKLGSMVSMVVPKVSGGLLAATPAGLMALDLHDGAMTLIAHPEAGRSGHRYNDGKCDRRGRLWIGSMDMGAAPNRGALWRVDADGCFKKMDSGFTVPNGLGWSPDNQRMYFTDTFRKTIYTYDFNLDEASITNRRPLITFDAADGKPDGLTVDSEGCLWVAVWDAWRLSRFSPAGEELLRVRLPVPRPTSCCFGGANLRTLYVTSASVRLDSEALAAAPLSGALFALEWPGVRGLPEATFAG